MKVRELTSYVRDGGVSGWRKLLVVGAALYLVMPFDAIPDVVPVVGWLDDVGVLAAVAALLVRDVRRHAEARTLQVPAGG